MAEVAAAPAPSTGAQPTAQPTPETSPAALSNFDIETVRDTAPPDTTTRLAKPIKPIPRLPGVFPDDDPFPSPPPSADTAEARSAVPPRGPDGRFVAPSSATPVEAEHTLEPARAEAPDGPFEFGGERFATRAAAEQNFKSLRGQFKPLQTLARSVGGVEQILPKFTEAATSARGWKAEAERWKAAAEGRTAQPAVATPTPQSPEATAQTAESADIDWDLYAEVKKLATERGEPAKADQWLIEQVRAAERAHFNKQLDERDAPRRAQEARDAIATQTETLFGSLADFTLEDGSPAFPELSDESASYEIGRLWASLGLPAKSALTPQGAVAAISLYRETKRNRSQASPAAATPPPQSRPPQPTPPTDALAAAGLTDGRPTVASVGGNGSQSAEAARILAGLRAVNAPNRSVLGFDA